MAALLIVFCVIIPLYAIFAASAKYECEHEHVEEDKLLFTFVPPFNIVIGCMGLANAYKNFDAFKDEINEFKENIADFVEKFLVWYEAKPKNQFIAQKEYRYWFSFFCFMQDLNVLIKLILFGQD